MSENVDKEILDNQANWDDRAKVHFNSKFYDVDDLIKNKSQITTTVKHDCAILKPYLPNYSISDLSLLHLQCHIGTDTLSWKRLGTQKTFGLDFSEKSLKYARQIAEQSQTDITYVKGDARFASSKISDKFDVVVTSMGTITWLPDLKDWANSIYELLKVGGHFLIRDDHPMLSALNFDSMTVTADYFNTKVDTYQSDQSYTDNPGTKITHTTNHNWNHDFQEIIGSLLSAGLQIEFLGEYDVTEWPALPNLISTKDGFVLPDDAPKIPLTFAIVAKKIK